MGSQIIIHFTDFGLEPKSVTRLHGSMQITEMSHIPAAIGRGQLRVLEDRVKRNREIFNYYQEDLGRPAGDRVHA